MSDRNSRYYAFQRSVCCVCRQHGECTTASVFAYDPRLFSFSLYRVHIRIHIGRDVSTVKSGELHLIKVASVHI